MQIKYSTKLSRKEIQTIKRIAAQTRIPQSKLLEEAIQLLEAQYANDIITPEFRRRVDSSVARNQKLLKRLAK